MPTVVRILLTGASGYLGQHLLNHFVQSPPITDSDVMYQITALYHKAEHFSKATEAITAKHIMIVPKQCNLVDYNEGDAFDVCIHTAAIANIRVCQNDPAFAEAINVPTKFFEATKNIPMIALSTDQVYNGKQTVDPNDASTFYQEATAKPDPLNVYAQTKLKMEETLKAMRPTANTYVLRSSIILGPKAPIAPEDAHDTFLHFCATRNNQETDLWVNEYRTVVSVRHACHIIHWMVQQNMPDRTCAKGEFHIFNLGGNLRVNRLDMAKAVFEHFGFESNGILKAADQTSPTVPLDISMDCSSLAKFTGIVHEPATLQGLMELVFPK
ncbi:unnamed protein product [Cylindrotheca closterium]|uniref:RmlD-like substrate binding domain-containing protein n=1 Tax=Cylindrotheca closterium TaxID=2856 RepID=A0AAD2CU28_9STRA|nr:unnamed protein product [Cylindrotheca closterium]